MARLRRDTGEQVSYYHVTDEKSERQIVADLREHGSDFVFKEAWDSAYMELFGDGQIIFYDIVGLDEVVFEGVVENAL